MEVKKKILLVDDDEVLASVYRARLELEGFDVREVHNGEDALTATLEYIPDLILLDAMMPKISGFDVLDILRNTPETMNTRVIMLTALSQDKDRQRAQQHQRQQPQKKCAHRMRCFPGCEDIGVLVSASHGVLPESMVSISL